MKWRWLAAAGLMVALSPAGCGGGGAAAPGVDSGSPSRPSANGAGGTTVAATDAAATDTVAGADVGADRVGPAVASVDAGAGDAGDAAATATAATWSGIYTDLFVNTSYPSNCAGAACHDPGRQKGIDLTTSAQGYATLRPRVMPGMPASSQLVIILQSGSMPQGRPRMAAAQLDRVRAWIQAGALNN